jgi:hypothetical protein
MIWAEGATVWFWSGGKALIKGKDQLSHFRPDGL